MLRNLRLLLAVLALVSGLTPAASAKVLFRRPLASFNGVYNFYDHSGKDWNCGGVRYSGHNGTDFKAGAQTTIYAAASGSLYYRYDNCNSYGYRGNTCGGRFGNHVRIEHPDGRVSIYAHMWQGSPAWYSSVLCGAYVGRVGSSGDSNVEHLHFEVWQNRSIGSRIDPYSGSCDPGSTDWVVQYYQSPIGNVSTACQ